MFVFEKGKEINIVLEGHLPVETPDFVIAIDEDARTITVNGTVVASQVQVESDGDETEVVEPETPTDEPTVDPEEDVTEPTDEPTTDEGESEE